MKGEHNMSVERSDPSRPPVSETGVHPTGEGGPEVSVVMPCLNEHETVGACVQKAVEALARSGLTGEVIVADNGSTDGSIGIAESLGARVVAVRARGYGQRAPGRHPSRAGALRDHG